MVSLPQTTGNPAPVDDLPENLIIGAWGPVKTAKTSLGLTFPQPIVHFDLDQGFIRAVPQIPAGTQYAIVKPQDLLDLNGLLSQGYTIISREYQMPLKFPGQASTGTKDIYDRFIIPEIMMAINDPRVKTIIYDTGTMLWSVCHGAELEGKKGQDGQPRQSLLPVEYAAPNQSMRFFLGAARNAGKNVYISHHSREVFQDQVANGRNISVKVGDTWDGWNKMAAMVDMVLMTGIDVKQLGTNYIKTPKATFLDCGYTLDVNGTTIDNPTYNKIRQEIAKYR